LGYKAKSNPAKKEIVEEPSEGATKEPDRGFEHFAEKFKDIDPKLAEIAQKFADYEGSRKTGKPS
jgi:hypothetical protein